MSKGRPAAELLLCLCSCWWPVRVLVRTRAYGLLGSVLGGWERGRSEMAGWQRGRLRVQGKKWPREGNGQELRGKRRVSLFVFLFFPKRGGRCLACVGATEMAEGEGLSASRGWRLWFSFFGKGSSSGWRLRGEGWWLPEEKKMGELFMVLGENPRGRELWFFLKCRGIRPVSGEKNQRWGRRSL